MLPMLLPSMVCVLRSACHHVGSSGHHQQCAGNDAGPPCQHPSSHRDHNTAERLCPACSRERHTTGAGSELGKVNSLKVHTCVTSLYTSASQIWSDQLCQCLLVTWTWADQKLASRVCIWHHLQPLCCISKQSMSAAVTPLLSDLPSFAVVKPCKV